MRSIARWIAVVTMVGIAMGSYPLSVEAQSSSPGFRAGFDRVAQEGRDQGIREFGNLSNFVIRVLAVIAALVAVLALGALIYGAVLYIVSLGDEGRTETAKKVILYAIIGLLVLGIAGVVVNVLINLVRS